MSNLKIIFTDGDELETPDISYERFENSEFFKSGSSDVEYKSYLRNNKMSELSSFNADGLKDSILVYKDGDRVLKFRLYHDSDTD